MNQRLKQVLLFRKFLAVHVNFIGYLRSRSLWLSHDFFLLADCQSHLADVGNLRAELGRVETAVLKETFLLDDGLANSLLPYTVFKGG